MKKFIVNSIVYFTIIVGLNMLFLFACIKLDWNFSKRVEAIDLKDPVYTNMILGNSLPMDGINSELLGSDSNSTYNLSIGGASIKTNYIQLKEYLSIAKKKPKRVVLAFGSYNIGFFENISIHPIVEYTSSDVIYKLTNLPMIKFKWIIIEMLKKIVSSEHRNAVLVQGQLRIMRTMPDDTFIPDSIVNIPLFKYKMSEDIGEIAALCGSNNIELILIEMPAFRKYRNTNKIGPYELNYASSGAVKLYNFNGPEIDSILNPKKDWLGGGHLNKLGAEKFTIFIRDYVID